ncbi:hypothetical protein OSH10_02700 [Kaistia defluvii]|uniref:hypothetical protein n=1 Tax=Kaistia defluvii TaxID=410841 RepID=UPI0022562073|nr:hypothetical protein [Kaistia defluvii]MCX5517334.1 hypothetical protein [Kaistia defluvii]
MKRTLVWLGGIATVAALLAASTGVATAISRGNMPAYCRGEVSAVYATRPMYVKTGKIVKARDGSLSIHGTVDKGSEGIKAFACRFDRKGKFIDVMAMTSDGE